MKKKQNDSFIKIKKKKNSDNSASPKSLFVIFMIVIYGLILTASITGGIALRGFINKPFAHVTGDEVQLAQIENTNGKTKMNVLIVGVDKSKYLSDVIMVVRYDEENNKLMAMSIPRDTYVNYNGSRMLINSVYGVGKQRGGEGGGINAISKTVTTLTGLPIHYYVQFEVGTFAKLVDQLGGVDFNVPQDMDYDDNSQDLHIHLKGGQQRLNGNDAESLVRFRGYPQADLKRVEVQQELFKALLQQKLNANYVTKLPGIYNAVKGDVKCNMTLTDMLKYGKSMLKLNSSTDIYTCTMPTVSAHDAHLYQDKEETDMIMETYFYTEGPVKDN